VQNLRENLEKYRLHSAMPGCEDRLNMVESTGYEHAEIDRTSPTTWCDEFVKGRF
jgi:hypothetical protein